MRQMVLAGPRKSKIIEVPIPKYSDDEMLVKVTLTGMCHSEWYPWATAKDGDVLGHESIGVVAEIGKNVQGFKVGDRVTGLGAIAAFKAMGYGNIIAVDKRQIALENAKKFGATETYLPEELPEMYISNFETIGKADLTRSGDNANVFAPGIPTVMGFTGTEDGLQLAGAMVKAHGRLGIGGYHNDGMRSIDFKLWNFKAFTAINCHERRIEYEAGLCRRCMELLDKGIWKFTGVTKVFDTEDFDKLSEMMEHHTDNFIKGAFRP